MARPSGIWPRKTRGGIVYYTKLHGKQIRLSTDEREAEEKFALLTGSSLPGDTSRAEEVCDEFLEHVQNNRTEKTYRTYSMFLNSFCDACGNVLVAELARRHATRWLERQTRWNPSTKASAGAVLKICFRWATEEGMISRNPFASLKKSGELKRERVLTSDEWATMLSIAREPFKTFLLAVRLSGCRPGEVRSVTDAMVNLDEGCWVIPRHKTRKKTGRPRVVWLCPELLELTKRLMQHGPGFLFRNNVGGQWSESSVVNAFDRLRRRMGLGLDVVCYSLRHTFASDAIETCDLATVAELLGHREINTTLRHYVHMKGKGDMLREAAKKAVSGCAGASSSEPRPAGSPQSAPPKSG